MRFVLPPLKTSLPFYKLKSIKEPEYGALQHEGLVRISFLNERGGLLASEGGAAGLLLIPPALQPEGDSLMPGCGNGFADTSSSPRPRKMLG